MSVASLHARLPAYEPGRAALQTAALAAFNRREIGGLRLAARLAATREHQGAAGWICFEAEGLAVAVSPLLADGMLARITGDEGRPDGVIAAALLGRIEPLIAAIETIIDKPLAPAGLAETVGPDRLMLRLDAFAPEGAIRHRLLLALPDGLRIDGADLPVPTSPLMRHVMLRWSGAFRGPRLARRRLASIGRGDLLLLGLGPFEARLSLPGRAAPVSARLDPARREAMLISDHDREDRIMSTWGEEAAAKLAPDDEAGAVPFADMPVPIRIEFDGGAISAGSLASLTTGSILPLAAAGEMLPVRLVAGDTAWAQGQLVAVGDGYGVLIGAIRGEAQ